MENVNGMKALIDGDILRYELGFAAETGWKTEDEVPPFNYVQELFDSRLEMIMNETKANDFTIFLSGSKNFRNDIAKTKVYKGTRVSHKPYHFDNLTAYITGMMPHIISDGVEADDLMCIAQTGALSTNIPDQTIIVSRDKDLRQCPGWQYGWELGDIPSFGPELVDNIGWLNLVNTKSGPKIKGCGVSFFYAQCLMGDPVDNVPGLPKCGPVKTFDILSGRVVAEDMEQAVSEAYRAFYGDVWEERLLEQGQLLWMVRRWETDGSPQIWRLGLYG